MSDENLQEKNLNSRPKAIASELADYLFCLFIDFVELTASKTSVVASFLQL